MNWTAIVTEIFEICIYPLLGLATIYLSVFLKNKIAHIKSQSNAETLQASLTILNTIVENCVLSTKQTYVDALKKSNAFDETARKMAFKITYDAVMASLTEQTKLNLATAIKDLPKYITDLIEAKVQLTK